MVCEKEQWAIMSMQIKRELVNFFKMQQKNLEKRRNNYFNLRVAPSPLAYYFKGFNS